MTIIYYLLTFAAGFLFGVFATALAVFSGDKEKRDYDRLKKEFVDFCEKDNRILLMPKSLVPKDVTMDEFCKWWKEEGYKYVEKRDEDNLR